MEVYFENLKLRRRENEGGVKNLKYESWYWPHVELNTF